MKRLVLVFVLLAASLTLAYVATQHLKYVHGYNYQLGLERQLNLDYEANLPAWFSSLGLLSCSLLLGVIWHQTRQNGAPYALHWLGLALIFLALSVDETAMIHETVVEAVIRKVASNVQFSGYLFYPWVVAGGVFVGAVGATYAGFVWHLPPAIRSGFVLSAVLYIGGALGTDLLEANHAFVYGRETMDYAMLVGVEETLEMAGVLTFLYVLSVHMTTSFGKVHLVLTE